MLDSLLLKAFIPEIFLLFAIFLQLIHNTFKITALKKNFPFMDKEILFQTFFILLIVLLLLSNVKIYGLFSTSIFINDVSAIQIKILLILFAEFSLIFIWQSFISQNLNFFEFFIIYLILIFASLLFINCFDFLSTYLVLELQALCFYIITGIKRNSSFSLEAALKYFIVGSYFSCIYLFGVLFYYSEYSIMNFYDLILLLDTSSAFYNEQVNFVLILGCILVIITLFFKLAVVPFHFWVPEVYDGAPLSTTIVLSLLPKLPLFTFLIRFLLVNYSFIHALYPIFLVCGFFSIFWGTYSALKQKRVKKLLIFSSISQLGLIIIVLSILTIDSISAVYFFLFIYLISAIVGWSLLTTMYITKKIWSFNCKIYKFSGFLTNLINLFNANKFWAVIFTVYIFSLVGMPPFAGFLSKFYILVALINIENYTLLILVLLLTGFSAFYYTRLLKIIIFETKKNYQINHDILGSQDYMYRTVSSCIIWGCVFSLFIIFLFPNFILEYCKEIAIGFF